jgi:UbiD family decarboxylase
MTLTERKPVAFGDLRGWIAALKAQGELQAIEVDWNIELGTIMRLAQGPGTGKALIFNNIKDYNTPTSRCRRIFGSALNNYRRIAMMLGLPPDTHPRELVKIGRTILTGSIAPKIVATGAVKENILKGADIDLYEFPSPHWNRLDGGRYLLTFGGCITKDPDTGVMNVGIYRGMVAGHDRIPILMWRAQHIGHHVTAWQHGGKAEMPIAVAIGWEPSLGFCAGSPVPKGICEYDVMGAIRGAPVELVKCETVDLYVPATAEIVIEGYLGLDPATYEMEGPYAEFTGYLAGDRSPKPTIRVTAITHRNDPILRGTIEGAMPGSYSENAVCSSIMRTAGACRHQSPDPDEAELSQPGQASRQRDLGFVGRARAVQAHHRGRRRHRHPRLCGGGLGDRPSGERRRERRHHHARDLRHGDRPLGAQTRPQSHAVRHRQVEPLADRRHHEPRLRPRPGPRRRPLPADGLAGKGRHREGLCPLE